MSRKSINLIALLSTLVTYFFFKNWSYALIVGLQLFTLLRFINNVGKNIPYLDFLSFYTVLDTLIFSIIGYEVYNENNKISLAWGKYMLVDKDEYFAYMIPANLLLIIGLSLFKSNNTKITLDKIFLKLGKHFKSNGNIGIGLFIVGLLSMFLRPYLPISLRHYSQLTEWLTYVGPVYMYFSNLKYGRMLFMSSIIFSFLLSIRSGMFAHFAMYTILAGIVVITRYRISFRFKILAVVIGLLGVAVLQTTKSIYREVSWRGENYEGLNTDNSNQISIFFKIAKDQIFSSDNTISEYAGFGIYSRMNQGQLISKVMYRVPKEQEYMHGKTLIRAVGGAFIPRIIWSNKPNFGGEENMRIFLGHKGKLLLSENIGPYGEGFGNFGSVGGILYVFIVGIFLSWLLSTLLKYCELYPSLLFFFPLIFLKVLSVETDLLTMLGSLWTSIIFTIIIFKVIYFFSRN